MLKKLRKSSGRVTLVLIGLASAAGCGPTDDTRRDVYASRDDCLADWGNKPEDCTPATDPKHRAGGYFYGPSYGYRSGGSGGTWTSSSRTGRSLGTSSSRSSGSSGHSSVSRGGFGSTGHSSSG